VISLQKPSVDRDDRRDESGIKNDNSEGKMQVDSKAPLNLSEATEDDMMVMMGFAGFGTTKVNYHDGEMSLSDNKNRAMPLKEIKRVP
jgi:hypothetical protein